MRYLHCELKANAFEMYKAEGIIFHANCMLILYFS